MRRRTVRRSLYDVGIKKKGMSVMNIPLKTKINVKKYQKIPHYLPWKSFRN